MWRLIEVSEIVGLQISSEHFVGEASGYKRGDKGMITIYAEL